MTASRIPRIRVRRENDRPVNAGGQYVLYWMTAARRVRWNFGLQRSVELARELGRSLVVLEPLRADYGWASERLHRFVLDGMRDNGRALAGTGVRYLPYVEPSVGAGRGLLEALSARACAVVTDEFPCFFLPRMVRAAARKLDVRLESVDSNGLLPLRATSRTFVRAFDFRRYLQKSLPTHLSQPPLKNPLARLKLRPLRTLPSSLLQRWPEASSALLEGRASLSTLPIDHSVPAADKMGGTRAGERTLKRFVKGRLGSYLDRKQPGLSSGLSPYLHFGHISVHQVLHELARQEHWSPELVAEDPRGNREGWWGMPAATESFLDQLVTWRELGFQFSSRRSDSQRYDSLPEWARNSLAEHVGDERTYTYPLEQLERAETHDELWNAAQRQLLSEGTIENYLRMLWGKKVLQWTLKPPDAYECLIELNNKYALDGRDPNSYSGIGWVFGRFDRPWGPERPIFGKVRYMTSENTRRKLRLDGYLKRWGGQATMSR